MKHYKGYRLYVALGPSQVRRRLKGHGFGVKKVQSAGRHQAVVIHTATGDHLRQLKLLFADVRVGESEADIGAPPSVPAASVCEQDRPHLSEQEGSP
jgi:hypothetical protein